MVWILLAALGIPLWMVAGALIATLSSRRHFKSAPGAFSAKLRIVAGDVPGLKDSWPRRPLLARWTHDVLVIQRGLALVRTDLLGVAQATELLTTGNPDAIHGLGAEPLVLAVVLDNGPWCSWPHPQTPEPRSLARSPASSSPLTARNHDRPDRADRCTSKR